MALAIAGLGAQRAVRIENAEIMGESFPDFAAVLRSIGARVETD